MHPFFNSTNLILVLIAGWLLLTVSICALLSITFSSPFADALTLFTPLYLLCLILILPNYYICRGLPLGQTPWLMLLGSQALTLIAITGLWSMVGQGYAMLLDSSSEVPRFTMLFDSSQPMNLAIVAIQFEIIVLIHYLFFAIEKSRDLEQAALEQKLLISQAELQTLKATVHPHFLFNSLNTLANIALSAPEQAHRFCLLIAEFLRYSVAYSKKSSVTLDDELEHIQNYLGIERERFGERLQTRFEIAEGIGAVSVPPLILFPIVENAIKHGIDSRIEGGTLTVVARVRDEMLVIEISNPVDELGRKLKGTGHGISSVERRLRSRYGDQALLKTNRESGAFRVQLYLPLKQPESPLEREGLN